jgi:DNA-binding NarL/FixJ family response regulator
MLLPCRPRETAISPGHFLFTGEILSDVQVVLLTAFESPALQQQAEEAGCFAFLVKGGPPGTLRTVLHQAAAAGRALLPEADSPALEA